MASDVKRERFRVGDTVFVRPVRRRAVIEAFLADIKGGVLLDRPFDDIRYWNVADLRLIRRETRRRKG